MNNEQHNINTGAIPSPKDARDWTLAAAGASTAYPSARFIDQSWMNVLMQGSIGCCVGCTGESVIRKIIYQMTGVQEDLSFRFVYALAKCLEGTVQPDGSDYRQFPRTMGANDGTYPALVAKILRKYGVPLAKFCPNDVSLSPDDFCYNRNIKNIPAAAFTDALKRRSGADFAVAVSVDGIKRAINYAADNNGGVMILRHLGDTYSTDRNGAFTWDKHKLLPIRRPLQVTSAHEEMLYGYDEEPVTKRIRIYWLNSWSKDWADNGRAWEYLDEWLPLIGELRVVVQDVPTVETFKYNFKKSLRRGMKGADIVALQHALKLENCYDYPSLTGFFGPITEKAVIKFQEKYRAQILTPVGLSRGTGFVGMSTLKQLNALYNK